MITYNHEKFIREAIDSVIQQKTRFEIELIIGEDFSTDKTRIICLEYSKEYPNLIHLLPSTMNLGLMPNFIRTLNACKGVYVSLCEGDDYWTDPYKLQKQVDFLESNPGYAMCFHNAEIIDEGTELSQGLFVGLQKQQYVRLNASREVFSYEMMIDWLVPTASCTFRAGMMNIKVLENPNLIFGDIALFLSLANRGNVFYSNEKMSVYRKSIRGSRFSNYGEYKNGKWERHYDELSKLCSNIDLEFVINYIKCKILIYSRAFFFYDLNWIKSYQKHKTFKETFSKFNKSNNSIPLNIKKKMLDEIMAIDNWVKQDQKKSINMKRYVYVLFKKLGHLIQH
jgi:glycosyltransferase involved in cell wall biosynthesis